MLGIRSCLYGSGQRSEADFSASAVATGPYAAIDSTSNLLALISPLLFFHFHTEHGLEQSLCDYRHAALAVKRPIKFSPPSFCTESGEPLVWRSTS